jgi:16S rRNA (cytosine1402-N4)-methyltransferase
MDSFHTPVLLREAVEGLQVRKDGNYIDATIGGGGHTRLILDLGGRVLGIDQDKDAISHLKKKFELGIKEKRLELECGNFADIEKIAKLHGMNSVDGILFDLGVSSYQIDESGRGFSFMRDEALDMRMSQASELNASEIINTWPESDLVAIFAKYGEEPAASEVAREIVFRRKKKKIETTGQLVEIIRGVGAVRAVKIHPATRIFQALRIVVNKEIENLRKGLIEGFKLLKKGGRLEIISFHSLEDRVVKLYFLELERSRFAKIITKKPVTAAFEETRSNRRARSAKLRISERL